MKRYTILLVTICAAVTLFGAQPVKAASLRGKTPKQVLAVSHKAMRSGDVNTTLMCLSKKAHKEQNLTLARVKQMLPQMKMMLPSNLSVIKTDIKGASATVTAKGTALNPFTQKKGASNGTILFVKENGEWKIERETWLPAGMEDQMKQFGEAFAKQLGDGMKDTGKQMQSSAKTWTPTQKETFTGLSMKIDGLRNDWSGKQPVILEVGKAGMKFPDHIDLKKLYHAEDTKYHYMFLTCTPTVDERWKKEQSSGGLCEIYINTDNNSTTGCKGETGYGYGKIVGYDIKISVILGKNVGSGGSKPYLSYTIRGVGENGKFSFFDKILEQSSTDKGSLIQHGKDGFEMAIPKSKLALKVANPKVLIKEDANYFDKDGYTEWVLGAKGVQAKPAKSDDYSGAVYSRLRKLYDGKLEKINTSEPMGSSGSNRESGK